MPKIDIVVPCYNYGRFLEACVASVQQQSMGDFRLLIIDDASSDDSALVGRRLAADDPRVSMIVHASNAGHIKTYNEGIAWASADYFLLLSADDLLAKGALQRATQIMDDNPDIVMVHGAAIDWLAGCPQPTVTLPQNLGWRRQNLVLAMCEAGFNLVCTPTAISRMTVQKRVGGYNPALPHTSDMHMWLRLAAHGPVGSIDHAVQAIYRKHATNMSNAYVFGKIRDFDARRQAFSAFFAEQPKGADMVAWHASARAALARQAYWSGLALLCRGEGANGRDLLRFAWELDPALRRWPPFRQLSRIPDLRRKMTSAAGSLAASLFHTGT